jgi:hypothetical protein
VLGAAAGVAASGFLGRVVLGRARGGLLETFLSRGGLPLESVFSPATVSADGFFDADLLLGLVDFGTGWESGSDDGGCFFDGIPISGD